MARDGHYDSSWLSIQRAAAAKDRGASVAAAECHICQEGMTMSDGQGGEYFVEKTYWDDADDIEAVAIHYTWTPVGELPNWDDERTTRFMPIEPTDSGSPSRRRVKRLKLPAQIVTTSGVRTDRYELHHYFEVCQGGSRHTSPRFTEEIVTGAGGDEQASRV